MSQIRITWTKESRHNKTGKDLNIMGGWDVPCQNYHLLIEESNPDEDDPNEGIIFCSMYEFPLDEPKTLKPLRKKAAELGITLPEVFWDACSRQLGNKFADVLPDGSIRWG